MSVDELGKYNDDGTRLGKDASEKVAFWGATPIDQPASANHATVTATLVTTIAATLVTTVAATAVTAVGTTAALTTAAHGYATGTIADAIVARVNQLVVDANVFDAKINQAVTDLNVMDAKINQAVTDIGALTTLTNQLRNDLVSTGLIKGSA